MNNCINNSYFHNSWKSATILPIPKKGKGTEPKDYRPISLTSNVGKILEKWIYRRLTEETREKITIPDLQFGFRENHSAVDAVTYISGKVICNLNKQQVTAVCLLDVEKAFDSVWIEGLMFKMLDNKINNNIVRMLFSFLDEREAKIKIGQEESSSIRIGRGVPQGTVMGPLLYNIYTAGQPMTNSNGAEVVLFADDTLIMATSISAKMATRKIQQQLEATQSYYANWGIKINENKTKFLIIRPPLNKCSKSTGKDSAEARIKLNNKKIGTTQSARYLGFQINHKWNFNGHIQINIKKAWGAYNMLKPICRKLTLPLETKKLLYKQIIRPVFTYGFPTWFTITPSHYKKLGVFERKILRDLTGEWAKKNPVTGKFKNISNKKLYEKAEMQNCVDYLRDMFNKAKERIENHTNSKLKLNETEQERYLDYRSFNTSNFEEFARKRKQRHHRG